MSIGWPRTTKRSRSAKWWQNVSKPTRKDGWALARKAELLLHDGKHGEALEVFQLAYKLNPEDDAIRSSLVRSLLSALRDDFDANHRFSE